LDSGEPSGRGHSRTPALDFLRGDLLDAHRAKGGHEVGGDDRAVLGQRRGLDRAIVLDVPQELRGGVGERRAGLHEAGQRPASRLFEHVAQPGFRGALRVVARRWAPALGPRRPDALLDLPAVRQPVLRVPGGPAGAVAPEDMACRGFEPAHAPKTTPELGRFSGQNRDKVRRSSNL
jgi:hypothetical protein